MTVRSFAIALVAICFWPTFASGADYARPELLAAPAELKDTVVLDARPREKFDAGHIPGARWVDHSAWAKAFDQSQDEAAWSERIGALGLLPSDTVVVYDDNLSKDAARIWWVLRYWGFEDARLLNGGWKRWHDAEGGLETTAAAPAPTRPMLVRQSERLATKAQLLASLAAHDLQIIDARSAAEFCGDEPLKNKRAGAIPGAVHLEWDDLLDAGSGRFKSADELAKLFADASIDLNRPMAAHCQSGGRSSVMVFGLELMGATEVRNYYRSWNEWGNSDDTPVVKGTVEK